MGIEYLMGSPKVHARVLRDGPRKQSTMGLFGRSTSQVFVDETIRLVFQQFIGIFVQLWLQWLPAICLFFKNSYSPCSPIVPVRFERVEQSVLDKSFGGVQCTLPIPDGARAIYTDISLADGGFGPAAMEPVQQFLRGFGPG
jgi:hypothetical protein